jgi:lipoprotein-anchoring transpeptidase ErfK/SrfK
VRIRYVLALMVAGLLMAAGVANAQTTTEPLSDYTSTTPTATTPTATSESAPANQKATPTASVAPSVASQPAGTAPSALAFTGAEPLLIIVLGLGLAGGAVTLLLRDRRRTEGR